MFLYSGLCFLTGTVPHIADVAVGRFCCGLASSIPTIVVAGGIEDMFDSEKRVWMVFAWGLTANVGLTLGPVYSTYVTEIMGW